MEPVMNWSKVSQITAALDRAETRFRDASAAAKLLPARQAKTAWRAAKARFEADMVLVTAGQLDHV